MGEGRVQCKGVHVKFVVVDDDPDVAEMHAMMIESSGNSAVPVTDSSRALEVIAEHNPDVVVLDIMMPDVDGFEILSQIRQRWKPEELSVAVVSSVAYEHDRRRVLEMGAQAFIPKRLPIERLQERLNEVAANRAKLSFWGVRGTLPVPGDDTLRYGGNTSCVSVEFPNGSLFIFDAGSGIKRLSDRLMEEIEVTGMPLKATIFISHPHWDHINALPFFTPLYQVGNQIEIVGTSHGGISMKDLLAGQMDGPYFPVTESAFGSQIEYPAITEGAHEFGGVSVQSMLLNHPGQSMGYRVNYAGRSVCYITDVEVLSEGVPEYEPRTRARLLDFIRGTQTLIIDSTYSDEEYETHRHWGHSSIGEVARLAHEAEVETLCLFHHDPGQDDMAIDGKLAQAQEWLDQLESTTQVIAPNEGHSLLV